MSKQLPSSGGATPPFVASGGRSWGEGEDEAPCLVEGRRRGGTMAVAVVSRGQIRAGMIQNEAP